MTPSQKILSENRNNDAAIERLSEALDDMAIALSAAQRAEALPQKPTREMLDCILDAFGESDYRTERQQSLNGEIALDAYNRLRSYMNSLP